MQQLFTLDTVVEPGIIIARLDVERPALPFIDNDDMAAKSGKIDSCRQPGRSAADDKTVTMYDLLESAHLD